MKKIITIITSLVLLITGFTSVNAASVPSSIKVSSMGKYNYGGSYYFPIKYTSNGNVAYCIDFSKNFPMGNTMTNPTKVNNGLLYILENGYKGSVSSLNNDANRKEYYITQLAIYTFLGQANPSNNNEVHNKVWNLVNGAKNAPNYSEKISMSLSSSSTKMTIKGNYFISNPIKVNINKSGNYAVSASKNVKAEVVNSQGNKITSVKNGDTVYLRMPLSSINEGQTATINMTIAGSTSIKSAYYYTPSSSSVQKIMDGKVYTSTSSSSANFSAKATRPVTPKVTEVIVSKQDITTSKELPGAKLVIKDAKGTVKATWVSTNTPKSIKGLTAGNYTLCETIAPKGYDLETKCIDFKVYSDGTVSKVTLYNAPTKKETVTEVIVSKRDITTKTELAGATLVIKDMQGKVMATIKTNGKAKSIKGLKKGFYTLEETVAPKGYVLSKDKIKFEVKEDQTSTVIFYNEKEEVEKEKVKISKQDIATKTELPGATLIIKDSKGIEIKRWVSTNTAVYFELEAGTYTLEEIQAPNGYILSTEKINFTVDEKGLVDKEVIMYNTREVEVPITDANASILMYGIGLFGLIFGFKKVVKNA